MTEPGESPQGAKRANKTYSLLGAPSLLYRSNEAYSNRNVEEQEPQESQLKNLQVNIHALNRTRARWYYPMDHRFRLAGPINPSEVEAMMKGIWLQPQGYNPRVRKSQPTEPEAPEDTTPHADALDAETANGSTESENLKGEESELVQPEDHTRGTGLQHLETLGEGIDLSDEEEEVKGPFDEDEDDDDEPPSDDEEQPAKKKRRKPTKKAQDTEVEVEDKTPKPKQRCKRSAPPRERSQYSWCRIVQGYKLTRTDILYREDFQRTRTLPIVDHARLTMLEAAKEDGLHIPFSLSTYRMFDHSYIPGLYGARLKPRLQKYRFENSRLFAQERRNFADPAYLAPFTLSSLEYAFPKRQKLRISYHKRHPIGRNDPNSPSMFGNCLVCETCPCPPCRNSPDHAGWCLVHPTGELLDRVRVSKLILPTTVREDTNAKGKPRRRYRRGRRSNDTVLSACNLSELDIGDTIREISKCGIVEEKPASCFITLAVRSACFVTVVRWIALKTLDLGYKSLVDRSGDLAGGCWRFYKLEKMHCIDLRVADIHLPSFTPLDIACHAKFGGAYSDRKIAILTQSRNTRNTVHHVLASDYSSVAPLIEPHNISCLSSISKIDFSNSHPMTLWAAANSYVRPALTLSMLRDRPTSGNGHSLFLVDLRADSATFQWSPSSEEFLTEGLHSISGIMTDWNRDNRLWVTSVSAGKTWELDSRMPCKVVSSWSLPGLCDDFGSVLPVSGLHGDGSIFAKPCHLRCDDDDCLRPVLSVGTSPGSFGLHLYQPPVMQPRFQTQSLEISGGTISSRFANSFVGSSMFPLPDVSDRVFTCGLAAFRSSTEDFLMKSDLETMGCSFEESCHVLSALTMTNKGDVYLHALLEQSSPNRTTSRIRDGMPFGSSALVLPANEPTVAVAENDDTVGFNLRLSLSNVPPLANSAVFSQTVMAQDDVQPFRSIPLCQPASTNQLSNWQPVPHSRSGPALGIKGEEAATEQQRLLLPAYDFDDPVQFGRVKMKESPGERPKSDVTSGVLESATTLWGNGNRHI